MAKVTIYIPDDATDLWHAFRVACVQRKRSVSAEVFRLAMEQLQLWHLDTPEIRYENPSSTPDAARFHRLCHHR